MPDALSGLIVAELSGTVAAGFTGKLLADLGAQVAMIEPSQGSALRAHTLFAHLSGAKASVIGGDAADRWLAAADVLVTDGTSPRHAEIVAQRSDRAIVIDLSPFGRTGPYARWQSSDLVTWALGGYLYFTGAPDREPIQVPGRQAQLHAGAHGAIAALAALRERGRSGLGQYCEVSHVEATLTAHAWLVSSWAACGMALPRQPFDLLRALDGWVYVMRIVPREELFVLIDRPDLAAENLTVDVPTWHANIPRIFEAVAAWVATRTVAENR
jgi:crotonobetainyl-CoA:carnitine CoA-transferase CaiB-like acyl-CoA transferase